MPTKLALTLLACLMISLTTSCAESQPTVVADTSCTAFRPITLSDPAIAALRPYRSDREAIVEHNTAWRRICGSS